MGEHRVLTAEKMFDEIKHLMRVMAVDIANPSYWQLAFDEVLAELYYKMVEVVWQYEDKPFDELKALVIKSLHNHKVTLKRRLYGTHRSLELGAIDLDLIEDCVASTMSTFILADFLASLTSDDSRALIQEMLQPSERTKWFIELSIIRKQATSPNSGWAIAITPLLMERALGWDKQRLETAWEQAAEGFREYISEDV